MAARSLNPHPEGTEEHAEYQAIIDAKKPNPAVVAAFEAAEAKARADLTAASETETE
jgi:hypothetical protein